MKEIAEIIFKLANDEPLEERYHDHSLEGNWTGIESCISARTGF